MRGLPAELAQNSRSDATVHNVTDPAAARYFDYESAVALRNLAAAYGTDMPRYLLAPEVAVLLSRVPDLRRLQSLSGFGVTTTQRLPGCGESSTRVNPSLSV